jgi:CDP-diacylglycerol--serine O-phosphatidyltransferase
MNFGKQRRREDPPRARRFRRGIAIIPSVFTSLNIAAGYYAIVQTTQGSLAEPWRFNLAAKAIGLAVLFDSVDGFLARMTNTSSDFGRELDSLADVITFGVAPGLLAFIWGFHLLPAMSYPLARARLVQVGAIASFVFLITGASRLARFNIQVNPQPSNPGRPDKKYFVGMPIPAAAGVLAAMVHFVHGEPLNTWWLAVTFILLLAACSFLMVSTWRFYSMKGFDPRSRGPYRLVILVGLIMAGIWYFSEWFLFLLALAYMMFSLVWRLQWLFRKKTDATPSSLKEASQTS